MKGDTARVNIISSDGKQVMRVSRRLAKSFVERGWKYTSKSRLLKLIKVEEDKPQA